MAVEIITALSPLKGAEGELKKNTPWELSPLPFLFPLHAFPTSFPRDRIDPEGLAALPELRLAGPLRENGNLVLKPEDERFKNAGRYLRQIHGAAPPDPKSSSILDWYGMLLAPEGLRTDGFDDSRALQFLFPYWQIGLYRLRYDQSRKWWEDLRVEELWKVRKPKG